MSQRRDELINLHASRNIDFLRGGAAILVVLSHLYSLLHVNFGWLSENGGWLGVQIFFVISGYLIIKSAERYSAREYFIHRFFRIWPPYIFWFVLIGLFFGQLHVAVLGDPQLYPHVFLMQHFFPESYLKYDVLRTSWTLTVEVVWYVLAFLLACAGKRWYVPAAIGSVVLATWWVYSGMTFHPLWGTMEPVFDYFFITSLFFAQLPFFLFGCLIATQRWRLPIFACFAAVLAIFTSHGVWVHSVPNPIFITAVAAGAMLYIAVRLPYSLESRAVRFFSDISYSVYLVHYPVILWVMSFVANKQMAALFAAGATVLISWLSYLFIEKPFLAAGRRLARVISSPGEQAS